MSDKALTNAELELTQRIQMYFPRGAISPQTITLWNGCPREALSAKLTEVFGRVPEAVTPKQSEPLLEPIGTVILPATTERFVARDRFMVNTSHDAPVRISYLGDNFKEWFLGQTEAPIQETALRYHKLRHPSVDGPIIAELGGETKAETALSKMFSLMEMQKYGQVGVLLNNGYASIFYIRDITNSLRAVFVFWHGDGWYVDACSVEDPGGWYGARRVFSRNS